MKVENKRVSINRRREARENLGKWWDDTTQPLRDVWKAHALALGLTEKEAGIFADYYTNRDTMHMTHGWRAESKAECSCFDMSDDEVLAEVKRRASAES